MHCTGRWGTLLIVLMVVHIPVHVSASTDIVLLSTDENGKVLNHVWGNALSGDGTRVAFYTDDEVFTGREIPQCGSSHPGLQGQNFPCHQVYVRSTSAVDPLYWAASTTEDGDLGDESSTSPNLNNNGRFVVFESDARNLAATANDSYPDVFLKDLETGRLTHVSRGQSGAGQTFPEEAGPFGCPSMCSSPSIDGSGRFVLFGTWASNMVPEDENGLPDVFLVDTETGTTSLISATPDGRPGDGGSWLQSPSRTISDDGRRIVFQSLATDLDPSSSDRECRGLGSFIETDGRCIAIYLHDRNTGETRRLRGYEDLVQDGGHATLPTISANGRFIAYNMDFGEEGSGGIILEDLTTGEASILAISSASKGSSWNPRVDDEGNVVFISERSDLTNNDENGALDVFLWRRDGGTYRSVYGGCSGHGHMGRYTTLGDLTTSGDFLTYLTNDTAPYGAPPDAQVLLGRQTALLEAREACLPVEPTNSIPTTATLWLLVTLAAVAAMRRR